MYNIGAKYVSAIKKSTFLLNFLVPAMNIDCVVSQHYNIGSSLLDTVTLNCTMEPVIYDHPLVPVILVVNDRWS